MSYIVSSEPCGLQHQTVYMRRAAWDSTPVYKMASAPSALTLWVIDDPKQDPFDELCAKLKQTYNQHIQLRVLPDLISASNSWRVEETDTGATAILPDGQRVPVANADSDYTETLQTNVPSAGAPQSGADAPVDGAHKYYHFWAQWKGLRYIEAFTCSVEKADKSVSENQLVIVDVAYSSENATELQAYFQNNFKALVAGFAAYHKGSQIYSTSVNVLKEVVPFLEAHKPGNAPEGWFGTIVDEVWHANVTTSDRIQFTLGDLYDVMTVCNEFFYGAFYCKESYEGVDVDTDPPDCRLADSVTLPAVEASSEMTEQLKLCFKRLEYYPVYAAYDGDEHETLIVGAGPTGLYAAYLMACLEKPFTLIESRQRWQTKKGNEAWTFLSRTQRIYLNTRWWEYDADPKLDEIWQESYRFVTGLSPTLQAAKEAVMDQLDTYALNMTGTPFRHRAHKPGDNPKLGYRCVQIWEAQEALLRLLMEKLKTFQGGRVWFNAKLTGSKPGFAEITRSGVAHTFKCKRIVSCVGATSNDKAVTFIADKGEQDATKLTHVTISSGKTTEAFSVSAFVLQPKFETKVNWTKIIDDKNPNAKAGDLLTNIRFFPGHNGAIDYVAFVFKTNNLMLHLKSEGKEELAEKIKNGSVIRKNGHSSLEASEIEEITSFLYSYMPTDAGSPLETSIRQCNTITWAPNLKLMRRQRSAFEKGNVVFLGDACAQPNFFTGTGFASGWSMADSFAKALEEESDAFKSHNDRVLGFVGEIGHEPASKLYEASKELFEIWDP